MGPGSVFYQDWDKRWTRNVHLGNPKSVSQNMISEDILKVKLLEIILVDLEDNENNNY